MAGLKILVVDDNHDFCGNVKDVVELFGRKAVTAYDGYQAIAMVLQNPPDVALIDVKMLS